MLHRYDEESLQFIVVKKASLAIKFLRIYGLIVFGIILLLSVMIFLYPTVTKSKKVLKESEILIIVTEHNKFSEEKLIKLIKDLHFNLPYIVYAQALLESDHFRSKIFLENNNLFGMKEATMRIHISTGTQSDYAYYTSWNESVYDYALYSATYLNALTKEEDYFNYLSRFYAEDPAYVEKLKGIINNENLKEKFNENTRTN